MPSPTLNLSIDELKAELRKRDAELASHKEAEKERRFDSLEDDVRDIRERLINKLFDTVQEQDRQILELQLQMKQTSRADKLQIAGGGTALVVLVEVIQYLMQTIPA